MQLPKFAGSHRNTIQARVFHYDLYLNQKNFYNLQVVKPILLLRIIMSLREVNQDDPAAPIGPKPPDNLPKRSLRQARDIFPGKTSEQKLQLCKAGVEEGIPQMLENLVSILAESKLGFGVFDPSGQDNAETGIAMMADAYKKGACAAVVGICKWLTSETDQSMVPHGDVLRTVLQKLQAAGETVSILGDKATLLPIIAQRCEEEGLRDLPEKFAALTHIPAIEVFAVAIEDIAPGATFVAPVMAFRASAPAPL